jgi:hypothetical protein
MAGAAVKLEPDVIEAAKKDALSRMTHFETMMTTIPTVELGVLAFVAKEFINLKADAAPAVSRMTLNDAVWYFVIVGICALTSAVHLHWVKIHLACVVFVLDLEQHVQYDAACFTKQTLRIADGPHLGGMGSLVGGIRGSWLLSSVYSLVVLIGAMLFFGIHLHIPLPIPVALALTVGVIAGFYILPDFRSFFRRLDALKSDAVNPDLD